MDDQMPEIAVEIDQDEINQRKFWVLALVLLAPMVLLVAAMLAIQGSNALFLPLLDGFKAVSALILSFLAGIRWTTEFLLPKPRAHILVLSFLPLLVGWASLLVIGPASIGILLIAICALGAWDSFYWYATSEYRWFAKIRNIMTLVMAGLHIVVLLMLMLK